ncbi:MAG TPA: hypothetical protein VEK08_22200 [Planctomycetota bacterium]|nr:hypothetical protein [Planctomycetota bacterium]
MAEPPETKNAPASPTATPAIKDGISQKVINGIVGLATLVLLGMVVGVLMPFVSERFWLVISFAVLAIFIGRFAYRMFFKAQSQLSEWLLTLLVSGGLMSASKALIRDVRDMDLPVALLSIVWAFSGSAWGWHAARRLDVSAPRQRLWLLTQGWLAVPAALSLTIVILRLPLDLVFENVGLSQPLAALLALTLGIPAVRTELLCQKRDGSAQSRSGPEQKAKPAAPPPWVEIVFSPISLLLTPLMLRYNSWIRRECEYTPVQREALPAEVADAVCEFEEKLRALGFELLLCLDAGIRAKDAHTWSILFKNHLSDESAAVVITIADTEHFHTVQIACVFNTHFEDGTEFATTVDLPESVLPSRPHTHSIDFAGATHLHEVLAVHRAWITRERPATAKTKWPSGGEVERMQEDDRKLIDFWLQHGWVFDDAANNCLRLTWKGALLLPWPLLWPFKSFAERRRRARAEKLCRELNVPYPA